MAGEHLLVTEGAAPGRELQVDGELLIGRAAGGEGVLDDDPELSRRHARIRRDPGGGLVIEDLGSANGTWVNGERIDGPRALRPGDALRMGQTTLVLSDPPEPEPAPTRIGGAVASPTRITRRVPGGEALRVTEGPALGRRIPLEAELLIGRSGDEEGRLGDDPEISRRHACITRDAAGNLLIEDLGSSNGTLVGGELVTEARPLVPGDTIVVGRTTLEVVGPGEREPEGDTSQDTIGPSAVPLSGGGEQLRVTAGNLVGKRFDLAEEFMLGRLEGADSTMGVDRKMSRRHARITRGPAGGLVIEDLGSANGTWVNDKRISGPRAIEPGDRITVGETTLEVVGPMDFAPSSTGTLPSVAGITYRARWPILALVVAFVVVAGVFGSGLPDRLTSDGDFSDPDAESVTTKTRLINASDRQPSPAIVALVEAEEGVVGAPGPEAEARRTGLRAQRLQRRAEAAQRRAESTGAPEDVTRAEELGAEAQAAGTEAEEARAAAETERSADAQAQVERVVAAFEEDPAVERTVNYYDTPAASLLSRDGRSTLVPVFLKPGTDEEAVSERLVEELRGERGVRLGGSGPADVDVGEQAEEDLASAEAIALPLLFVLSLFVFRGLVAALLPLFVGIVTVLGTFLALRLVTEVTDLSIFALNMVVGLGLGVAIDYSLFILSRYREELERMGPGPEPLRRTLQTAGRTVLFSSITVAVALLSLLVFPQRFLYSMGIGGAVCTALAATTALVALPALLAVLGPRVNALSPGRKRAAAARPEGQEESGFWYRLSRWVMRRPLPIATVSAALLIAAGVPFLGVKFTGLDSTALPQGSVPREVDEAIDRDFAGTSTSPVSLAVTAPSDAGPRLRAYRRDLAELRNVDSVSAPERLDGRTWQIDVTPAHRPLDERSLDVVRDVRALRAPFPTTASGESAEFVDQQESLRDRLPLALAILCTATIVVLFLMTGSVLLPIKSVLMNFLGLTATLGILVLIFQDGYLEGPLDFTSQGALNSTQPILLFVVAFGLSTDYGVFLLTRIKEVRDAGAPNDEAVAIGLERTGRIVTAAALLFSVAMGAFATSGIVFVKLLGVGAVLAVIIDATIVRALLVPALMAMLGERNWWAPRPLRWLHDRIGLSEG